MSVFSPENFCTPITIEDAWTRIVSAGKKRPCAPCLLPYGSWISYGEAEIIWLERFRQCALEHCGNLSILKPYVDFQEYVKDARPDPTHSEWIWLYSQIAEHAYDDLFRDLVQIMACRNALLPFLESIPDKELLNAYHRIKSPWLSTHPIPAIPYQGLEAAIQEDAPNKVAITKMMCRNVTDEEILNRAIALGKGAVVASMLGSSPIDRIIEIMIDAHANWENPAPLFERLLPQYEDGIAAWRDSWSNGFFWYLYRRPVLSMDIIRGLPPKILATFETKNIYGISPEDLWSYYRPSSVPPEN